MKTLSLTRLLTWLGLRNEGLFQRVESPTASSVHLTELSQLDTLLGKDFDSIKAFLTRKMSSRWGNPMPVLNGMNDSMNDN